MYIGATCVGEFWLLFMGGGVEEGTFKRGEAPIGSTRQRSLFVAFACSEGCGARLWEGVYFCDDRVCECETGQLASFGHGGWFRNNVFESC